MTTSHQNEIEQLRTPPTQAEAALRQTEARYRAFMDNSPCVAFLKDAEGRLVYGNAPLQQLLALGPADLVGKTDFELFPGEIARRLRENDAIVMASGRPVESVEVVPKADGTLRTWLVMKFPVPDERAGCLLGGVAVDITERQRAEEALRQNEERFRQVAENIQEVIWMTDTRSRQVLYVSPAYERVWGHSCQSLYEHPRLSWTPSTPKIENGSRPSPTRKSGGRALTASTVFARTARSGGFTTRASRSMTSMAQSTGWSGSQKTSQTESRPRNAAAQRGRVPGHVRACRRRQGTG